MMTSNLPQRGGMSEPPLGSIGGSYLLDAGAPAYSVELRGARDGKIEALGLGTLRPTLLLLDPPENGCARESSRPGEAQGGSVLCTCVGCGWRAER